MRSLLDDQSFKLQFAGHETFTLRYGWLKKAADAGDAQAQVFLGDLFTRGKGVPKDLEEAARYFNLAAEQGDSDGQKGLKFVNLLLGRWTVSEDRLPGEDEWEFKMRRMVESTRFCYNPPDENN